MDGARKIMKNNENTMMGKVKVPLIMERKRYMDMSLEYMATHMNNK